MDTTPTDVMFKAMQKFVDTTIGEAPSDIERTSAANQRREARNIAFGFLHNLVRLSMREGIRRDRQSRGMPVVEDHVRPNPLSH